MLLKKGDLNNNVKCLQQGLRIVCINPNGTESAVIRFQSKHGIVASGIVNDTTWEVLCEQIMPIQQGLINAGYSIGGIDGIADSKTYDSIVDFQRKKGLTAEGMAGEGTKKLLFPNNQNTAGYVLSRGAKGDAVRIAQLRLIELGYSCGASGADSQFGGGTYNAVVAFQKQNNLTPDGIAGSQTLTLLYSADAKEYTAPTVLKRGDSGVEVENLQVRLISLGYVCGNSIPDGMFGGGTYNSVCDFQRLNGLKPDGVAGPETLAILYSSNPKRYEVIPPTIPVIPGTNDIIDYTVQVILRGEGNYTAINEVDPISIGILQWYQERAHDLLCSIKALNEKLVQDTFGKESNLVRELNDNRSVFKGRYLTSDERSKMVTLLGSQESRSAQDQTARIDVSGYIEDGKGKSINEEKALIYYADLYNQSPKQTKLIVESISGTITLDKLHQSAMANSIMNQYVTRRNKAYDAAKAFLGSVSIEKFVDTALAEAGFVETYNNITKYGEWYGMNGQPWCAMFVSWCASQSGLIATAGNTNGIIPKYASVQLGMEWYVKEGRFASRDGEYTPKYGDILFLKTGASHTAIVVGYDKVNNKIYTIEGNYSDKVCKVWRYANDSRITGYGTNGSYSDGYALEDAISGAVGSTI